MATDDLTLRMRAVGARGAAKDVDRTTKSVKGLDKATDKAGRSMRRSHGSVRLFTSGLRPMVSLATSAGAALGILGFAGGAKFAIKAASDLSEEINKTKVVFRGSEAGVLAWSKTASNSFGQSRQQALEAAGVFGNMLVPMGFARDRAAQMSKRMVMLASDMASFNNASPSDTLDAIRAGLAGESEPLRRFGVFLNDARLKQQALSMGLYTGKGNLDANAKAAATYALILKDTKDAQGDFARTSGGLANMQRTLKAQFTDLAAELGGLLLPEVQKGTAGLLSFVKGIRTNTGAGGQFRGVVVGVANALSDMWGFAKRNQAILLSLTAVVLGGVAAYKAFLIISTVARVLQTGLVFLTMWRMGTLRMTAAQWGLNTALLANPIALVLIALVAIGAGLFVAYQRSESFRNAVDGLWGSLKGVGSFIGGALVTGINLFIRAINLAISAINLLIRAHNLLPGKDAPLVGKVGLLGGGLGDKEDKKRTLGGPSGTGHLARGGLVKRTGVFEVGERGRETVALPAGTSVQPHGGGGDLIVHNYLTLDGKVAAQSTHRQAMRKLATR